jgi:hypothetical protein
MLEQLENTYLQALDELNGIRDGDTLTEWDRRYLGKKGAITLLLRATGQLPKEDRAAFGQRQERTLRAA